MVLGGERDSRHHVMDDIIYIQANLPQGDKVGMYQPGREFTNKETGELLGQEVILSASGRVVESGEVSKVKLLNNFRETKAGFRVLAIEDDSLLSAYFIPKPAIPRAPRCWHLNVKFAPWGNWMCFIWIGAAVRA